MIKRGDKVTFRPEYQDEGESRYTYVAVSDEGRGMVDVQATNFEWKFAPINTVPVTMLKAN